MNKWKQFDHALNDYPVAPYNMLRYDMKHVLLTPNFFYMNQGSSFIYVSKLNLLTSRVLELVSID